MKVSCEEKKRKNSRDLILKEAFKLFLQKNVEKVTVPDLEKATGVQRGAIFYHFKDKQALFVEVIERYFFSKLNIFYPLNPEYSFSINEYIQKKNDHLSYIIDWFQKENLCINPYISFFHLTSQACIYYPTFIDKMSNLLEKDKLCWCKAAKIGDLANIETSIGKPLGDILRSMYIEQCFNACYNENDNYLISIIPPKCQIDML